MTRFLKHKNDRDVHGFKSTDESPRRDAKSAEIDLDLRGIITKFPNLIEILGTKFGYPALIKSL